MASLTCVLNSFATASRVPGERSSRKNQNAALPSPPSLSGRTFSPLTRKSEFRTPARIIAMATESSSESTITSDLLKGVQEAWEKTDDKLAIGSLGFAGLILLWGSTGLISAIDKLPILPTMFELVGLAFTGWFVYRYLLFKPDREELIKLVDETKGKITGASDS